MGRFGSGFFASGFSRRGFEADELIIANARVCQSGFHIGEFIAFAHGEPQGRAAAKVIARRQARAAKLQRQPRNHHYRRGGNAGARREAHGLFLRWHKGKGSCGEIEHIAQQETEQQRQHGQRAQTGDQQRHGEGAHRAGPEPVQKRGGDERGGSGVQQRRHG